MRKLVAAVVYRRDGKFLILRRKLHWKGWEFVKGRVENETQKKAVLREMHEETGLKHVRIVCKLPFEVVYHHKPIDGDTVSRQVGFLAEYRGGRIRTSFEHGSHRWVDAIQARKMLTHYSHRAFLRLAVKHIRKHRRELTERLSRKHVTRLVFTGKRISLHYDGSHISYRVVKTNVNDVGRWSYTKPVVFYDKHIKKDSVLPIVLHEAIEKHVSENYGLDEDTEAHKVATAVEKEFLVHNHWLAHQRKTAAVWVKTNRRKVGSTKFF